MIRLFTGRPGNGKSYHIARETYKYLRRGKTVISNVNMDVSNIKSKKRKPLGHFIYLTDAQIGAWDNKNGSDFINGLEGFACNFHQKKKGYMKEHQTLVIIDECQQPNILNCRTYNAPNRVSINNFLQIHRHYGFDIILATQHTSFVDKQARNLIQCEEEHRKLSTFKTFGKILTWILGKEVFVIVKRDLSLKRTPKMSRMGAYYMACNKRICKLYNSSVAPDVRR